MINQKLERTVNQQLEAIVNHLALSRIFFSIDEGKTTANTKRFFEKKLEEMKANHRVFEDDYLVLVKYAGKYRRVTLCAFNISTQEVKSSSPKKIIAQGKDIRVKGDLYQENLDGAFGRLIAQDCKLPLAKYSYPPVFYTSITEFISKGNYGAAVEKLGKLFVNAPFSTISHTRSKLFGEIELLFHTPEECVSLVFYLKKYRLAKLRVYVYSSNSVGVVITHICNDIKDIYTSKLPFGKSQSIDDIILEAEKMSLEEKNETINEIKTTKESTISKFIFFPGTSPSGQIPPQSKITGNSPVSPSEPTNQHLKRTFSQTFPHEIGSREKGLATHYITSNQDKKAVELKKIINLLSLRRTYFPIIETTDALNTLTFFNDSWAKIKENQQVPEYKNLVLIRPSRELGKFTLCGFDPLSSQILSYVRMEQIFVEGKDIKVRYYIVDNKKEICCKVDTVDNLLGMVKSWWQKESSLTEYSYPPVFYTSIADLITQGVYNAAIDKLGSLFVNIPFSSKINHLKIKATEQIELRFNTPEECAALVFYLEKYQLAKVLTECTPDGVSVLIGAICSDINTLKLTPIVGLTAIEDIIFEAGKMSPEEKNETIDKMTKTRASNLSYHI
jgi:hypothetical protein